jgi:hypothetical protein
MRWSLILSTSLTVLSTLSVALVIPLSEPSVDLERRAVDDAKTSSKTYRKNSENHDYVYKFGQTGGVTREKLKLTDRPANGRKIIMIPNTDADHVYEHQMFNSHLQKHGLQYDQLDPKLQEKSKSIINGAKNMAPVPRKFNRGKGQTIKHGLKGNAIKPNKGRDEYTLLSYKTARKTAKNLDKAFKDHGHDFQGDTFHKTLRNTMNNAKIMDPNDPSPKSSDHGSSKASTDGSSKASSSKASSDKASSDHGSAKASSDHGSDKASSDHGSDKASSEHGSDKASSDHGSVKAGPSPRKNPFIMPVGSPKPKVVMRLPIRRSSRLQAAASNSQGN